jgi:hypothetical protein
MSEVDVAKSGSDAKRHRKPPQSRVIIEPSGATSRWVEFPVRAQCTQAIEALLAAIHAGTTSRTTKGMEGVAISTVHVHSDTGRASYPLYEGISNALRQFLLETRAAELRLDVLRDPSNDGKWVPRRQVGDSDIHNCHHPGCNEPVYAIWEDPDSDYACSKGHISHDHEFRSYFGPSSRAPRSKPVTCPVCLCEKIDPESTK